MVRDVVISFVPNAALCEKRGDGARAVPSRIDVQADGSAVAWYGDAPLLWYESLNGLLSRHGLSHGDLEPASAVDDDGERSTGRASSVDPTSDTEHASRLEAASQTRTRRSA